MRLKNSKLHLLNLPFKLDFKHAVGVRDCSDSFILEVNSDQFSGFGEAVYRNYVNGTFNIDQVPLLSEFDYSPFSSESVMLQNPKELLPVMGQIAVNIIKPLFDQEITWPQVQEYLNSFKIESSGLPVFCAVETALLDLFCQEQKVDIYQLIKQVPVRKNITYSGIIPIVPLNMAVQICNLYQKLKIKSIRIKLGKDREYNHAILKLIRSLMGSDFDIRVDVNRAWDYENGLENLLLCREFKIEIIEEPFINPHILIRLLQNPVSRFFQFMADESILSSDDLENYSQLKIFNCVNIRLSKNGGLLRSIKLANLADKHQIRYQLGCHVGETGILSCLGRIAASLLKNPLYVDGSYDELLLSDNITYENYQFKSEGKAFIKEHDGIGYKINPDSLHHNSIASENLL